MPAVLFVCLGNICRSPAAEGILLAMARQRSIDDLHVESCGMSDRQVGKPRDPRMCEVATKKGYSLEGKAQAFEVSFFDHFDYIFAADRDVLYWLNFFARNAQEKAKLSLITAFSQKYSEQDIPDPYYGSGEHFDEVLDMLEDACRGILKKLYPMSS